MEQQAVQTKLQGRYTIERELSRSGMAVVFVARDELSPRRVAIKVLGSERVTPASRERFQREIGAAKRLIHPNILPVLDAGAIDGTPYYVMPFIKGESLEALLRRSGSLPVSIALDLAVAVASALEHAHRAGIVHRDVTPGNVLIPGADYRAAVLSDFGLQGRIEVDTQTTVAGQIFGTPTYMAPEQVLGQPQSTAADVFGLGALLYRMVYGRPPFEGESPVELMHRILREPVTFPATPAVARSLRDFIARCLEKEPSARPAAPLAELRRLQAVTAGPPEYDRIVAPGPPRGPAQPPLAGPTPGAVTATATPAVQVPASAPPRSARRVALVVTGAIAGAAVIAVAATVLSIGGAGSATTSIGIGVALAAGGVLLGVMVRQWLHEQRVALSEEASRLLSGTRNRAALTMSLAIEVDQLMLRCRTVDERFLGASLALMIDEFQQADGFDDRHRALAASVEFLEKLMNRLSPWYVRYEKLIAAVVALLGIVPGVYQILETLWR